jgi:hypothetical protein
MKLWWPQTPLPGNVGDLLGPYMYQRVTGETAVMGDLAAPGIVLSAGSIARFARRGTLVWGSGAMRETDELDPEAEYLAVRGPLTRDRLRACGGDCPEVYGDPGLLLPRLLPVEAPSRLSPLGIVPHYVDFQRVQTAYVKLQQRQEVRIINPLSPVEEFVRALVTCSRIISSSLHGLVLAHAYGIPARWAEFSDGVNGKGFKFRDYFLSVGLWQEPLDLRGKPWRWPSLGKLREQVPTELPESLPDFNPEPLVQMCPWGTF